MKRWLNLDVPDTRLEEMYSGEDYYWYLKSTEFRVEFLAPLGRLATSLGGPVLDVGCGEGWLADYVEVPYIGVDGSHAAIARAKLSHPGKSTEFYRTRIEDPTQIPVGHANVIVFGGIFGVLIKLEEYIHFIESYREQFAASHFIIYDLEPLDTTEIEAFYTLIHEYHGSVKMELEPDIKKHRKILGFSL